jgi:hypothetical protein
MEQNMAFVRSAIVFLAAALIAGIIYQSLELIGIAVVFEVLLLGLWYGDRKYGWSGRSRP